MSMYKSSYCYVVINKTFWLLAKQGQGSELFVVQPLNFLIPFQVRKHRQKIYKRQEGDKVRVSV